MTTYLDVAMSALAAIEHAMRLAEEQTFLRENETVAITQAPRHAERQARYRARHNGKSDGESDASRDGESDGSDASRDVTRDGESDASDASRDASRDVTRDARVSRARAVVTSKNTSKDTTTTTDQSSASAVVVSSYLSKSARAQKLNLGSLQPQQLPKISVRSTARDGESDASDASRDASRDVTRDGKSDGGDASRDASLSPSRDGARRYESDAAPVTRRDAETNAKLRELFKRHSIRADARRAWANVVDDLLDDPTYLPADVIRACDDDVGNPIKSGTLGLASFITAARDHRLNGARAHNGVAEESVQAVVQRMAPLITARRQLHYGEAWWAWCESSAAAAGLKTAWEFAARHYDDPWPPAISGG